MPERSGIHQNWSPGADEADQPNEKELMMDKNISDCQKAYDRGKREALQMLRNIEQAVRTMPDDPEHHWASVGTVDELMAKLQDAYDYITQTGEYGYQS